SLGTVTNSEKMPLWSTILECQMQFNSYNFRTNRLFSRMEISMILRFLAVGLFAVTTVSSQTPASLPSSFQQRTIHSPEGEDIFCCSRHRQYGRIRLRRDVPRQG